MNYNTGFVIRFRLHENASLYCVGFKFYSMVAWSVKYRVSLMYHDIFKKGLRPNAIQIFVWKTFLLQYKGPCIIFKTSIDINWNAHFFFFWNAMYGNFLTKSFAPYVKNVSFDRQMTKGTIHKTDPIWYLWSEKANACIWDRATKQ